MQNQITAKVSKKQASDALQADILKAYRLIRSLEASAKHYDAVAQATESIGRYCQALDQAEALRAEIATIRAEIADAVNHPGQAIRLYRDALSE